jgi:FkbM family methyltransferase
MAQSLKATVRSLLPPALYGGAAKVAHGATQGMATALGFLASALPTSVRVRMRERLPLRGRLDYDRADIYLRVSSDIERRIRLHSCEKEPETITWLESSLRDGDVLYDIGANVGAYSLVAARVPGRNVRVCAFEPGAMTFESLSANIALNGLSDRVTALPVALSRETALLQFTFTSVEAGSARHGGILPGQAGVRREHVMGFRLDDVRTQFRLPEPTHIKIDVDGSEHLVLEGARDTLKGTRLRSVMVETAPGSDVGRAVHALLTSAGFTLAEETPRGSDANCRYERVPVTA